MQDEEQLKKLSNPYTRLTIGSLFSWQGFSTKNLFLSLKLFPSIPHLYSSNN